ncbi:AI-2E family transporter [Candidatus Orientia mediorientalis]|uniref:AI-2E family transporter n=1 Tax=Candidatus Orientia mediorientalis TaxID=911112 RepID=UPI0022B605FA|nr:AI-2E family transporter [Candidatus Orientia mediorientalis]
MTPKLIGSKVGLHPVWIYFSVLTCNQYLGLIGIFFAIPIAIIIKILCKTIISTYNTSLG